MKVKIAITVAMLGLALCWEKTTLAQDLNLPHIYWVGVTSDGNWGVFERRPSAAGPEIVSTLRGGPSGVAADPVTGLLYWLDVLEVSGSLWSRGVEGSSEIYSGLGCATSAITDLVVDPDDGFAYIGINGDCGIEILKGDLSGNNLSNFLSDPSLAESPQFMALDRAGRKLYWVSTPPISGVRRSNLDGTAWETVLDHQSNGIDVDPSGTFLYWAISSPGGPGSIHRYDLHSGVDTLIIESEGDPFDVATDASGDRIFWTERSAGRIRVANSDGSDVQDVLSGLREPTYLSLGPAESVGSTRPHRTGPEVLRVYPNPFVTELVIEVSGSWATAAPVDLSVFDMLGRRVHQAALPGVPGTVKWDARTLGYSLPSGLYAVVLRSGSETRSVLVSKQ